MNYTIGELIVIEIALHAYFKDMDISLYCAKHVQQTIAKTEYLIAQIDVAGAVQKTQNLQSDPKPNNK